MVKQNNKYSFLLLLFYLLSAVFAVVGTVFSGFELLFMSVLCTSCYAVSVFCSNSKGALVPPILSVILVAAIKFDFVNIISCLIIFVPSGLCAGILMKKQAGFKKTVIYTALVSVLSLISVLVMKSYAEYQIVSVESVLKPFKNTIEQLKNVFIEQYGSENGLYNDYADTIEEMYSILYDTFASLFVGIVSSFALIAGFISYMAAGKIMSIIDPSQRVESIRAFRMKKLDAVVFIVAFLFSRVFENTAAVAMSNLAAVLQLPFLLSGFCVFEYWMDKKGFTAKKKTLLIIAICFTVFFPLFDILTIMSFIGVFDTFYLFRDRRKVE